MTQLLKLRVSLEETRGRVRSNTCQPNTCFYKADNTHCRLQQNQAAALLGMPDADMQQGTHFCTSITTNFVKSFHCSGSAMCTVRFIETSLYGDEVIRRHFVTSTKPPIFSRIFLTASNLSSKGVVFNP